MSTTKLLRWSGLASILAGVLYTIATLLHPPGEDVPAMITAAWVPAHAIGWVANSLLLLGLVGLYGRQAEKTGWLGLLGFVLAFIGVTVESGGNFSSVTLMPDLAATVPDAFTTLMNRAPFAFPVAVVVFGLTLIVSRTLGFLLFGIATMRANVLPPLGGVTVDHRGLAGLWQRGVTINWRCSRGDLWAGAGVAGLCTLVRQGYGRSATSMNNNPRLIFENLHTTLRRHRFMLLGWRMITSCALTLRRLTTKAIPGCVMPASGKIAGGRVERLFGRHQRFPG